MKTDDGKAAVVRNGHLSARDIRTGIGPVTIQIPKIRFRKGGPVTFRSVLVPPYVRKTRSLEAAIPPAISKRNILRWDEIRFTSLVRLRFKRVFRHHCITVKRPNGPTNTKTGNQCPLMGKSGYTCGLITYSGLWGEDSKLCALVIIGVDSFGNKQFLAIEDGVCESKQSWKEVLLKLKDRGMNIPQLAIGDGAMGFWAALEEEFGKTKIQRC